MSFGVSSGFEPGSNRAEEAPRHRRNPTSSSVAARQRSVEHARGTWRAAAATQGLDLGDYGGHRPARSQLLGTVVSRASTVVQANIAAARWREDPAECLIKPAVDDIGVFDFDRAADTIQAGRLRCRRVPTLRAPQYVQGQQRRRC